MLQPGGTENLDPVTLSYLVELSIVAPSGQEAIADEMKAFSEQLKPYPSIMLMCQSYKRRKSLYSIEYLAIFTNKLAPAESFRAFDPLI